MRTARRWLAAIGLAALLAWGGEARAVDLHAVLGDVVTHFQLPGAVLLVSGPDGTETVTTGFANLASRTPVTAETRFHVASVGKMLTALAILQLADEGKLALSDPVAAFVDERSAARLTHLEAATIARLLSHTSGLPDCLRNASFTTPEHPGIAWTAPEALRHGHCRPPTTPGQYAYSNTNFILLGHILEKLEGENLATILARRILRPLAMEDSMVEVDPSDARLAHGYRKATRKDSSMLAWSSRLGDAPLTTTAADLERLFKALFRPGANLLSPTMLAAMKTEQAKDDDEGYGYGLKLVSTDAGLRYGHNGRFGGFSAEAWYYPEKDVIVVLLANGDEHSAEDVMDLIEPRLFPAAGPSEN